VTNLQNISEPDVLIELDVSDILGDHLMSKVSLCVDQLASITKKNIIDKGFPAELDDFFEELGSKIS
jgi:hypothetical protein